MGSFLVKEGSGETRGLKNEEEMRAFLLKVYTSLQKVSHREQINKETLSTSLLWSCYSPRCNHGNAG